MSNAEPADLLSRLEVIQAQPLADRAEAFDAIHQELARRLETESAAQKR